MRSGVAGLGPLLVLGLGLGLLRNNATTSSSTPSTKAATNTRSAQQPATNPTQDDLLGTIASFLPEQNAESANTLVPAFQKLAQRKDEINFAIALVPDPVHTHLSLFFDRTIDAIQQGAQQANWIFDRAIMPWDSQVHPESTDFHVRLQQQDYQAKQEELPGLMIFRPAAPLTLNQSLFIFVVGETPTGGVNKKQFNTAVQAIAAAAKGTPLRIIGPTFSGSLYSLAQLLNNELPSGKFNSIVIRSGTVSSWNTTQCFEKEWLRGRLGVDFATFQQSDRYMLRKFVEFEGRRGYAPEKIALLAEDETAYGNIGLRDPLPSSSSTGVSTLDPCRLVQPGPDEAAVLHLYFPRDISQLRSAYQQGFDQHASSSTSTDSYQVRSTLPLNLQDSGTDDDTVQQYAHSETPLSQEAILLGIVDAMRKGHIEFVVLQATNPMDTLFLSAFLKKGYSEARVVATPADLLLSRDVDDISLLHGVMTLSTYSLLPGIDEEVAIPQCLKDKSGLKDEAHADHVFPNAVSAGTYNAALSQIRSMDQAPLKGCEAVKMPDNLPVDRYTEYGWPSLGGRQNPTPPLSPVVWLTVLGRGGFWPVAILDDGSESFHAKNIASAIRPIRATASPSEFKPPWPLFWRIVCGFVLMLETMYLLFLCKGSIFSSFSAMTVLAPVSDPLRPLLIAIMGWLILAAQLLLLGPWFSWTASPGWVSKLPLIFGCIATLLFCGISVQQLRRRKAAGSAAIFLLVAVALVVCFVLFFRIGAHSRNPFLYRYIHLTSGVSPLLPFLCLVAAGLWWVWFSLLGLALVDKRRPQLPSDGDFPPGDIHSGLCEESARELMHVARPFAWSGGVYGPALVLIVVTLCALDYGHPVLTLEARHFEWIFALCLAGVAIALTCTTCRLLVVWLECRKILISLDRFPLRRAFAELNFAWEPIWRLGGGRWQDLYRLVARQLEALDHLKSAIEGEVEEKAQMLVRSIDATVVERNKIYQHYEVLVKLGSEDPNAQKSTPAYGRINDGRINDGRIDDRIDDGLMDYCSALQRSTARTCAVAFAYLQTKWRGSEGLLLSEVSCSEGAKEKKEKEDVKKDTDAPKLSLSTRLAERFVALVYLNFILNVLLRMRTLAIAVGGIYIFLLLSVNSYPFEPKVALQSLAILTLIFVLGIVGYVFAHVHRDSILSLVTRTNPGELGIEFWLRIGTFAALPLLSLLVSQFPTLNNALFSWLQPAVGALK